MTSYDTDLLVVGGGRRTRHGIARTRAWTFGDRGRASRESHRQGVRRGLMPGGLAELTSLGVDPVGLPFHGIAYVGEHRRVQARFRTGPGRGVRRTTLHAALAARAKEQDTEWIRSRVATIQQDAHGVTAAGVRAKMVGGSRWTAFGRPARRRDQSHRRDTTAIRGALALPAAGVVGLRRSALVPLG